MVDGRLLNYIKKQLSLGYSIEEIKKVLIERGTSVYSINECLNLVYAEAKYRRYNEKFGNLDLSSDFLKDISQVNEKWHNLWQETFNEKIQEAEEGVSYFKQLWENSKEGVGYYTKVLEKARQDLVYLDEELQKLEGPASKEWTLKWIRNNYIYAVEMYRWAKHNLKGEDLEKWRRNYEYWRVRWYDARSYYNKFKDTRPQLVDYINTLQQKLAEAIEWEKNCEAKYNRACNYYTQIVNEKRNISAEMAIKLSRYFSTDVDFWLNLQNKYDVQKIYLKKKKNIEKVKPFLKINTE